MRLVAETLTFTDASSVLSSVVLLGLNRLDEVLALTANTKSLSIKLNFNR